MITAITIAALTCLLMILAVLFFPKIKIKNLSLGSYWVITLVGAAVLLLVKAVDITRVKDALFADTAINPLKILVLFISLVGIL